MQAFDLTNMHQLPDVRFQRSFRWFIGGCFAFLVCLTSWDIVKTVTQGSTDILHFVGLVLVIIVDALFGSVFLLVGPQAQQILVDKECIRLVFRGGRVQEISLHNPNLVLRLRQTTGAPDRNSRGRPTFMMIDQRPSRTFLTPEAFDGILAVARESGLAAAEEASDRPGWKVTVLRASVTTIVGKG